MILYTIGHSKHTLAQFAGLLKPYQINMVMDVRSIPYSRHAPQFNRTSIRRSLNQLNIEYEYMGDMIGGRFSGSEFLDENGILDLNKVVDNESFQKGIDIVIDKTRSGQNIALMCAEKDPLYCHRFLLISRELVNRGVSVIHLLAGGSAIDNDELIYEIAYSKLMSGLMQIDIFSNNDEALENRVYQLIMMKKMKKIVRV